MSDNEGDYATIEEVAMEQDQPAPSEPGTAKSALCNRCENPVFGDNKLNPAACCYDLICGFCWDSILCDNERCRRFGCENAFLRKLPMYTAEDDDDLASREREVDRQLMLDGDPHFPIIRSELEALKTKTERQNQQIQDHTQMQIVLDNQVRQSADRLESVRNETRQLTHLAGSMEKQADELSRSNDLLEEEIAQVIGQTDRVERLAASLIATPTSD